MRHFMIRTVGLCVLMAAIAHSTAFSQGGGSTWISVKPGSEAINGQEKIIFPNADYMAWGKGEYDYVASGGFIFQKITMDQGTVDNKGVFTVKSGPYDAPTDKMANPKTWAVSTYRVPLASGSSTWFRARLREIHTTTMEVRSTVEATGKYTAP